MDDMLAELSLILPPAAWDWFDRGRWFGPFRIHIERSGDGLVYALYAPHRRHNGQFPTVAALHAKLFDLGLPVNHL